MVRVRLWTKFVLSFVIISSSLTCATLLIVRHNVQLRVREEIVEDLRASLSTFQNFQRQREITFTRSAQLLADLPNLKALMTTQDSATIQDGSRSLWTLAGSDLFVLADNDGKIVALHMATPGFTRRMAQDSLRRSLEVDESRRWWFGGRHLYQIFLQPIYFGAATDNSPLGVLAVGHEIDDSMANEVSRIASSEVAFHYGKTLVVSTLSPQKEAELARHVENLPTGGDTEQIQLGTERFLTTSVDLASNTPPLRLSVLISYDQATLFLDSLNRLLFGLGIVAVLAGSSLIFLISRSMTKPLANLVSGVRALEKGDFSYPIAIQSRDEVAELTRAFERMRGSLERTQQQLLDAERLATIGRMASSISHDLRHPLTAVVANAEFLCERNLDAVQREDLYQEIRSAVDQVTDLVDSLLEFSRARESLRRVYGPVERAVEHAVQSVRARPEFCDVTITVSCEGRSEGWFDPKKLERGLTNLLLNACEAVAPQSGKVEINLREAKDALEISVADNGPGVPVAIRDRLFQPFVSYGKQSGTGLGLTVAQKVFQDHGGDVVLESTRLGRTVFKLSLPLTSPSST